MNILFLHPNFPGQFKHLSKYLAQNGHHVKFLCQTHFGRKIPGVERLKMKGEIGFGALEEQCLNLTDKSVELAKQYRQAFEGLNSKNWKPDLIISHSSWGCGLYAKEIWPSSRIIAYLEWWFDPESEFFSYDETNIDLALNKGKSQKYWLRNQTIALELATADQIVAPTNWQKLQLPKSLQRNCQVIFDGIDSNVFVRNESMRSRDPLVTYGTRGMEPMRAFPQFIKSIPQVVKKSPDVQFQIAGDDKISYGGNKPAGKTWKAWACDYLKNHDCFNNVKWMGYLAGKDYINWLSSSWCHVYLTHPFVVSWSFAESLFIGPPIVASNVKPVRELSLKCENVVFVDHRHDGSIAEGILYQIESASNSNSSYINPNLLEKYDLKNCLRAWDLVANANLTTIA